MEIKRKIKALREKIKMKSFRIQVELSESIDVLHENIMEKVVVNEK